MALLCACGVRIFFCELQLRYEFERMKLVKKVSIYDFYFISQITSNRFNSISVKQHNIKLP